MSWEDVEDAIQDTVARASELAPERVIWKGSNKGAPALDYIAMELGSILSIGLDYLKESQDLNRPNGQEIRQEVRGLREVALELEGFSRALTGSSAARAVLEKVRSSLLIPALRARLGAQGITPFDPGAVGWIPDIASTTFRGRAICSIRLYMPLQAIVEYVGYISRVRGTVSVSGTASGTPRVFPFDTND